MERKDLTGYRKCQNLTASVVILSCQGDGRVSEGGPSGQGGVTLGKRMNSGSRLVYQILHTYLYPYLTTSSVF